MPTIEQPPRTLHRTPTVAAMRAQLAAVILQACAGYVVVSGYACPLYAELYEAHGWCRVDKATNTNSGAKRIESLWLSPRTWAAISNNHDDLPMFQEAP